jgi:hypothetical protein
MRRRLTFIGLLLAVVSVGALTAAQAGAATLPPRSGTVSSGDPDYPGLTSAKCTATLAAFVPSNGGWTVTYALTGQAHGVLLEAYPTLTCSVANQTGGRFTGGPGEGEYYGAGYGTTWLPKSATHITVCLHVNVYDVNFPTGPPGSHSYSKCA